MVSADRKRHNRTPGKAGARRQSDAVPINASMRVMDIVSLCEGAEDVFAEWGIHCAGCTIGGVEMLSEACTYHGLDEGDLRELVAALNTRFASQPEHPAMLSITAPAARAVAKIAADEHRTGEALLVTADGMGGFCMEFQKERGNEKAFSHPEVPEVEVLASPLTLRRIGGSTIDYRDGRFKLDLPEERCADCEHDTCQCGKEAKV